MSMILVTPLSEVEAAIRHYRPSHLVTLLSPEHMIETPYGVLPERHLRLGVDDVADDYLSERAPRAHCWAGVSRSMAAAFVLLCDRHGPGRELEIAHALRWRAAHAYPNPLIVRLADEALGRKGHMISAAEAIGRGVIVAEGERVELPLSLDALLAD